MTTVKIKVLPGGLMPEKKTAGAAAWDCHARIQHPALSGRERYVTWIHGGETSVVIPLGFAMEIPAGYHAEIYPRSYLGAKRDLRLSNSVGIIDSDYRGEVCAILDNVNQDGEDEVVKHGERIVQMIIVKDPDVELTQVYELDETERGDSRFGSTGKQ